MEKFCTRKKYARAISPTAPIAVRLFRLLFLLFQVAIKDLIGLNRAFVGLAFTACISETFAKHTITEDLSTVIIIIIVQLLLYLQRSQIYFFLYRIIARIVRI